MSKEFKEFGVYQCKDCKKFQRSLNPKECEYCKSKNLEFITLFNVNK